MKGYVLAGGLSSRFGSDKAVYLVDGVPLAVRIAEVLRAAGLDPCVVARTPRGLGIPERIEPDGHGLTILPFFSGERSTGWADYAKASIVGINLGTHPVDILRASLEAVSYRFAAIYERLREELPAGARIIASGGGILASRVWTQMMADVIGLTPGEARSAAS